MSLVWSIEGNRQRLDGGAMFGNAPRAIWCQWIQPDEENRIPLACRAMLLQEEPHGRWILVETGIGAFFEPKLRARFGIEEDEHVLLANLAKLGLSDRDIDIVVLSHLHFDHAGGLLAAYQEGAPPRLCFPNAEFVVSEAAWNRACAPHPRDRASFIADLPKLLRESGRLEIVTADRSVVLGSAYRFHYSHGHTPGLMLIEVPTEGGPIVYASDLIPGRAWMHLPITMGYDRYPEQLIDEKEALLTDLHRRNGRLFFTHDPDIAMARVTKDDRGRFTADETWPQVTALCL